MSSLISSNNNRDFSSLKFDGDDFGVWRMRIEAYCEMNGCWDVIENSMNDIIEERKAKKVLSGEEMKENELNDLRDELNTLNKKATSLFMLVLGKEQLRSIMNIKGNANEIWKLLCEQYESKTIANKSLIRKQLYNNKLFKIDIEEWIKYIGRITQFSVQLTLMGEKINDSELLFHLTNGLPDDNITFTTLKTSINSNSNINLKQN